MFVTFVNCGEVFFRYKKNIETRKRNPETPFFFFLEFFLSLASKTKSTLFLSLSLKNTRTHKTTHKRRERARASLAGYTTTTRGSLANARGKESVVAANST